jgi:hypothetical protein
MNVIMRPSAESAGYTAESVKKVICCQALLAPTAGPAASRRKSQIPMITAASSSTPTTAKNQRLAVTARDSCLAAFCASPLAISAPLATARPASRVRISLEPPQLHLQVRRVLIAQRALLLEGAIDNLVQLSRHPRIHRDCRRRLAVQNRLEHQARSFTAKGRSARRHLVQHDTQTKNRSVRSSSFSPRTCSGDMYATVPMAEPGLVSKASSVAVAIPGAAWAK